MIQAVWRGHAVRLSLSRWIELEDSEEVTDELEDVRVAVARFRLTTHVDFHALEDQFSSIRSNLQDASENSTHAESQNLNSHALPKGPLEQLAV